MITLYNIEVNCNVYLTIVSRFLLLLYYFDLLCLMSDDLISDLGYSPASQWVNQTIIRLSLSRDRPYTPMIV
jgi:hypothetical protein